VSLLLLSGGGTLNGQGCGDGTYFQIGKWCVDDLLIRIFPMVLFEDRVGRYGTYGDIILLVTYNQHRPQSERTKMKQEVRGMTYLQYY
jgi:hypothetical protein